MPAVAELLRHAERVLAEPVPPDELPEELTGPVAYSERWLWIALALVVAVAVYYLASWWLTRPGRGRAVPRPGVVVPGVRAEHLARIDRVAAEVRAGSLGPREGHQQLSEVVRSYVGVVTTLPARTMALADFRTRAPQDLVDAIELMYPPEFAPDEAVARDRFAGALARARELVSSWS